MDRKRHGFDPPLSSANQDRTFFHAIAVLPPGLVLKTNMAAPMQNAGSFNFASYIRGFHVYMNIWDPEINEVLTLVHEKNNKSDKFAMAVLKSGRIVGHAPRENSKIMYFYMQRGGKITVRVTGTKVNRSEGVGLEIPGTYTFVGPEKDTKGLAKLLKH